MTDYVAFDSDNSPISVYEYKNRSCEKDIFCICGKKLFFRDESIYFERVMYGKKCMVQRACHFSHFKGDNCIIPKLVTNHRQSKDTKDKPKLTEEDKRIKRLKLMLISIYTDEKLRLGCEGYLKEILMKAKKQDISFEDYMSNHYKKSFALYQESINRNKTNYKHISFKQLPDIIIEPNVHYRIVEIDYSYPLKTNKKNKLITDYNCLNISHSFLMSIVRDFDLYCHYLKQLSLIYIYYSSRCSLDNIQNLENELKLYDDYISKCIYQKSFFIDDE